MRILHLSDIHFGTYVDKKTGESTSAHFFVDGSKVTPVPAQLRDVLLEDVTESPDVVIVSGDLGWSGTTADYGYAEEFLRGLRDHWPSTRFVIAPGNHDVDLDSEPRQAAFLDFLRSFYGADFAAHYPLVTDGADRGEITAFHLLPLGDRQVEIVALNSAARIEKAESPVIVDHSSLKRIKGQLAGDTAQRLRICVIHHHLFPFIEPSYGNVSDVSADPPQDLSVLVNSGEMQRWLIENQFHFVFHGHKHRPHGRRDTLWQPFTKRQGTIFVVAAGSSGVAAKGLGQPDSLSFNIVEIAPEAGSKWHVDVDVREIAAESGTSHHVSSTFKYAGDIGEDLPDGPNVFHAETVPACHGLIARRCRDGRLLHNFVCIVDSSDWKHPATAMFQDRAAEEQEVKRSFRTLHPEWELTQRWADLRRMDDALREISPRYQFQHGPRLFATISRAAETPVRPIERAVDNLRLNQKSHAYVGLYRPDIDALPRRQDEPLPGLMSLQFVERAGKLDAVATFRKIELSFWWAVNMYEVRMLLDWAAKKRTPEARKPGRIIFFAALAEWKAAPEATLVSQLDEMSLDALISVVMAIHQGRSTDAVIRLRDLLIEKRRLTDEKNLDSAGLKLLNDVVRGVRSTQGLLSEDFQVSVEHAFHSVKNAAMTGESVEMQIDLAHQHLDAAVAALPSAEKASA